MIMVGAGFVDMINYIKLHMCSAPMQPFTPNVPKQKQKYKATWDGNGDGKTANKNTNSK